MVWVSPGMLETKVMVAPNSPIALAKPSTMPAEYARQRQRQRDGAKHLHGAAPSVLAACSSRRSIASIERRIGRTSNGNDITPQASAAPVQRNANTMPRWSASHAPTSAAAAEGQQQQIAGDDRRQHQRQMDERIENRLAPKIISRQQPRQRDTERRRHQRRNHGDAQRQQYRRPFGRRDLEHQVDGLTRNLKPYFSRMFFAAVERRKAR